MRYALNLTCLALFAAFVHGAVAAPKKADPTWTDPAKAAAEDPDFLVQGEYVASDHTNPWGLQVVALGDGAFDAYLLAGGLPGEGWERGKPRIKLSGKTEDGTVLIKSADGKTLGWGRDRQFRIAHDGGTLPVFDKVERKSPTLGARPPDGAIVLFDGSSADEWKNGRVENGLLPASNAATKRTFRDYSLHVEFRTPFKPFARGQGRGNSGVYHQGRYETQVLDSFGLEGRMNECGGIYSIADSKLNMCYPPLSWQTYDVDFTAARFDGDGKKTANARMTVRLNGVAVHENQELPKTTTAAPIRTITPEPGPIFIQNHGNPVYYRNIWIVEK